jgi:flagellar protein FliS
MAVTPRPQLVVRLYERLLSDLRSARVNAENERIEPTHRDLLHAQDIVFELSLALDVDSFDGAAGLKAIYDHLEERLMRANLAKSPLIIGECIEVVAPLVETWQQVLTITQTETATESAVGARPQASAFAAGSSAADGTGTRLGVNYSA